MRGCARVWAFVSSWPRGRSRPDTKGAGGRDVGSALAWRRCALPCLGRPVRNRWTFPAVLFHSFASFPSFLAFSRDRFKSWSSTFSASSTTTCWLNLCLSRARQTSTKDKGHHVHGTIGVGVCRGHKTWTQRICSSCRRHERSSSANAVSPSFLAAGLCIASRASVG